MPCSHEESPKQAVVAGALLVTAHTPYPRPMSTMTCPAPGYTEDAILEPNPHYGERVTLARYFYTCAGGHKGRYSPPSPDPRLTFPR